VDALASEGDEGSGRLLKVSGSCQSSIDPEMSEWGNPLWQNHSILTWIYRVRKRTGWTETSQ